MIVGNERSESSSGVSSLEAWCSLVSQLQSPGGADSRDRRMIIISYKDINQSIILMVSEFTLGTEDRHNLSRYRWEVDLGKTRYQINTTTIESVQRYHIIPYITSPSTTVARTLVCGISCIGTFITSRSNTTKSAFLPGVRDPRSPSAKDAYAASNVIPLRACARVSRCSEYHPVGP